MKKVAPSPGMHHAPCKLSGKLWAYVDWLANRSETKKNFMKLRGFERFMNSSFIEKTTDGQFLTYGIVPPYVDFPVK
jgi:hypothetical protein